MNGPDLSKMPPSLTAAIIIALISAAVVLEMSGSPNTMVIITVLVGVIGLQQARTSQTANRIEQQTNGTMTGRFDQITSRIDLIVVQLENMNRRFKDGDRKFDEQANEISSIHQDVADIREQLAKMPLCEVPVDGEGS